MYVVGYPVSKALEVSSSGGDVVIDIIAEVGAERCCEVPILISEIGGETEDKVWQR